MTSRTTAVARVAMLVRVVLACSFASPLEAAAFDLECRSWMRLSEARKLAVLDDSIEDVVSSSRGRSYRSINRTATRRCLEGNRNRMIDDFDDICSRDVRASMAALNETFISYVWSCAQ
jgi:sensor histidine kinase regulating citrate/malate metabolism